MPETIPTPFGTVTLRPITDADLPFLLQLYGTTREAELAQVPWSDEQKAAFVLQQFEAQHAWWQQHYTGARWDLVLVGGKPAGRLYVDVWEREIRVVDIAMMPEHRGRGIGSILLRRIFREGDALGKPVSIHVEVFNPARRLYDRLGFVQKGTHGDVYLLMERPVGGAAPAQAQA
ncbi:MAG TPA: GNAT family N-acetyltransferase [Longimicrobium sp.]|nr:GNAT family N-acetyltransferase [Longimicrobium sp.]